MHCAIRCKALEVVVFVFEGTMTIIKAFFVFGFACIFVFYVSTGGEPYAYISFLQQWLTAIGSGQLRD